MKLPDKYKQNMQALLGSDFDAYADALSKPSFKGLRVNTLKLNVDEFKRISPFLLTPVPWTENGFYYSDERPAAHPFYQAGLYYIQEPSAMISAASMPIEEGDRVLDLCAAPGGKSTELAAKLKGSGVLVSNDVSASRTKALLKNLEVFGTKNLIITCEPVHRLADRFPAYFDKILVDAPCSGEGMFRKNEDLAAAWSDDSNEKCAALQREILKYAVRMLKPGGMLLYSTCTFSPDENERSVEWLLSQDEDLFIADIKKYDGFDSGHPEWGDTGNSELEKAVRLWPHRVKGEGHFACLFKKKGERSANFAGDYRVKYSKQPPEVNEFFSRLSLKLSESRIESAGDRLYYIPECFPEITGLKIVRCGLYLGERKKNRFEPSQALAMALKSSEFDNVLNLDAADERVFRYLKGETIEIKDRPLKDGWCLITVNGYPLGWGKNSKGMIKNKYLAGWRLGS